MAMSLEYRFLAHPVDIVKFTWSSCISHGLSLNFVCNWYLLTKFID